MITINSDKIILETASYVKERLYSDSSGHDWWHIYRVWKLSITIASKYPEADRLVIELAALLHDIADWKEYQNDSDVGIGIITDYLSRFPEVHPDQVRKICSIVNEISFKGTANEIRKTELEFMIVQDADRLDAMGAIGIARTFAYGGKKGQLMYDPGISPSIYKNSADYIINHDKGTAFNHFYEKLLLLRDLMNTEYGKELASARHKFMEEYLDEFLNEFNGRS